VIVIGKKTPQNPARGKKEALSLHGKMVQGLAKIPRGKSPFLFEKLFA